MKPDVTTRAPSRRPQRVLRRGRRLEPWRGRTRHRTAASWGAVPKATYYNVQLYRNGKKILTAWPTTTSFRIERSWRFDGRVQRLTSGAIAGTSGPASARARRTGTGS